jgi:molybdopterin-guanine dinucleotide biosynthesis protein A
MDHACIILAGGAARRMGGGDKPLLPLAGRPLIAHVIDRLGEVHAISANGDPARYASFGLPVLPDRLPPGTPDRPGPLAGVLAGMDWAAGRGIARIVTVPGDTPFLPRDLVARLLAAGGTVAMATHEGRDHPVAAAWDVALRDELRAALAAGLRRPVLWADGLGARRVAFAGDDPFFNVNTPADLEEAGRRAA